MQNGKTLMQVFDADYVVLNNKPIVRLFGKTETGGTVCALWDKFFPYFYVQCAEEKFPEIISELKKERTVEVFDKRTGRRALVKKSYDIVGEPVERFLPIGYGPMVKLLKIIGKDPSEVPEMREIIQRLGHKVYEADILFKYRFMIDNFIKGMNWVEVDGSPIQTSTIKCTAIQAKSIKPVEILKNAPLKYLALDIETISPEGKAIEMGRDQIIMISLMFSQDYRGKKTSILLAKNVLSQDSDTICCSNEEEMLKKLLEIIKDFDPDFLIGYNINNFDIPYIDGRMRALNISRDFSRADKSLICKKGALGYSNSILGRVIVDPYEIIKRDVYLHFKRYDLGTIGREMLGIEKLDIGGPKGINEAWRSGPDGVRKLVTYARRDSELAMKLVLEKGLIDKFFEIAKISGLLLQDCFAGQSGRIESMVLQEFRDRKFVLPPKPDATESARRKAEREKHGLKGAIVLEPTVGLHSDGCVLVLDFTSLYPSIVRTFNICPTTLLLSNEELPNNKSPIDAKFVKPEVRQGTLPKILKFLMEARASARKQYRTETNPEVRRILDAKQGALKILANSVTGDTQVVVKNTEGKIQVVDIEKLYTQLDSQSRVHNIVGNTEIIELEGGWETLSLNGDRAEFRPLYAVSKHNYNGPIYKIKTKAGEVKVTKDHSIITVLGKPANRAREAIFKGLDVMPGCGIDKDTLVAHISKVKLPENKTEELNLIEILRRQSISEKLFVFIPKNILLNRNEKVLQVLQAAYEKNNILSVELQRSLGVDSRTIRRAENFGLIRVGSAISGNGRTAVYSIDDEGEELLNFYSAFRGHALQAGHYRIPFKALEKIRIPRWILKQCFIASDGRRKIPALLPATEDMAKLFGWFVSEGSVYTKKTVKGQWYTVNISNKDEEAIKRISSLIKNVFDYEAGLYKGKSATNISINLKLCYLLFSSLCGRGAENKQIPEFIINGNAAIKSAFLRGYMAGDGDADGLRATTKSRQLAAELSLLFKEQGWFVRTYKDEGVYRICLGKYYKGEKIIKSDLCGLKPREITSANFSGTVYDLSVKDTENFATAQGIVLHNSIYGYTGYARARLYVMEVAGSITGYGRENIGRTTEMIEKTFKTKVVYGDTDSIFVKTEINDLDRAQALGEEMAAFATKNLPGLELKFEKIFKSFLILTKKRYAGWSFEKDQGKWKVKIDMKGIETVRRDWCGLVGETMNEILKIILTEQDVKKATLFARQIIKDLQAGKVPVEKLTVVKGISKSIESYGGLNKSGGKLSAPAHVQLAKKIQARDPSRGSMVGERIPYVIIKGNQMLSARAEDPDFVREKGLEIDGFYYVENQLLPPLERIFEACGIAKAELIEGSRQKSLFEMANGKNVSPEQMVLQNFDGVVCKNCAWTFRRPPLVGHCPSCSGNLYFSSNGSMGKFVAVGQI